ncbi:MAG: hydrogenase maturation protease [Planctomycetes bacterium]|nr:hydrogenase maturation protease [Planctomycetota bacterium]
MGNDLPRSHKEHKDIHREEILSEYPVLIIGIGNTYRSDDAVGLCVAQHLKRQPFDCVNVIEENGDGVTLMDSWKDAEVVIIIDAVYSGAKPGTIHRFDAHIQSIPTEFFHYSTHAFGVAEGIELARAIKQLPQNLIVYGIEGKCFEAGTGLSLEVEMSAQEVVKRVQQDIHSCSPRKH